MGLVPLLPDRFAPVTQHVDGLHRRAGSPDASTYPIHGDISLMRCEAGCTIGAAELGRGGHMIVDHLVERIPRG